MVRMSDLFVVIPTMYMKRKKNLDRLIKDVNVPFERIIVIRTIPGPKIKNVVNIFSDSELNIQKWWNLGINYGLARGGRYFLILNDDCQLEGSQIHNMYNQIKRSNSAICINISEVEPGWGHCFMIDFLQGGYFDEKFSWWYGDFDYLKRIEKRGLKISITNHDILNLDKDGSTRDNASISKLVKNDYKIFRRKHKEEYINYIKFNLSLNTFIRRLKKTFTIILKWKD
jgi:GT2 family glycosyltransferase